MDFAKVTVPIMEVIRMSAIKRWYEDHISELSDEELFKMGYDQEDIDFLRECFQDQEP